MEQAKILENFPDISAMAKRLRQQLQLSHAVVGCYNMMAALQGMMRCPEEMATKMLKSDFQEAFNRENVSLSLEDAALVLSQLTLWEVYLAEAVYVPCLFVDLDRTIIRHRDDENTFIDRADDVILYPSIKARLIEYSHKGYSIFGVSNQGGVSLGHKTIQRIQQIETVMIRLLGTPDLFSKIFYAYYHPESVGGYTHEAHLRKPDIGMVQLANYWLLSMHHQRIDYRHSLFVGDQEEDFRCAANAGIPFIWAAQFREI